VNRTSATVPLWEEDCVAFLKEEPEFEVTNVTRQIDFQFCLDFALANGLEVVWSGTTVSFREFASEARQDNFYVEQNRSLHPRSISALTKRNNRQVLADRASEVAQSHSRVVRGDNRSKPSSMRI